MWQHRLYMIRRRALYFFPTIVKLNSDEMFEQINATGTALATLDQSGRKVWPLHCMIIFSL